MTRMKRLSPQDRERWLRPLTQAQDLEALEAAYQGALHTEDGRWRALTAADDRLLHQTLIQRGWAVIDADPEGERIPRIVRTPHSFRGTTYRGQRFPSGTWGNSAGYRYTVVGLRDWVQEVGGFTEERLVQDMLDWILSGFPHRALLLLKGRHPVDVIAEGTPTALPPAHPRVR